MNILDAIRLATELADKVRNTELKEALVNVKMEAVDQAEEVVRLRQENLALKEAAKLRDAMVWRDDVWWAKTADGPEVPHCPKCWGGEQKAIPLADGGRHQWVCPVCAHRPWRPGGRAAANAEMESQDPPGWVT